MPKNMEKIVREYALATYTFNKDYDGYLALKLINKHMTGKRVLDLGCGPIVAITSLFYPEAREVVALDRLKENIDFARDHSSELQELIDKAKTYKHRFLSKQDQSPNISYVVGDVTKKYDLGKFDSVMQVGCFGCLSDFEDFQKAVNNTYAYLKKGGTLLMLNWSAAKLNEDRPLNNNGKSKNEVDVLSAYKPAMLNAGYRILDLHTTTQLSDDSKRIGYDKIIWAVARKV